MSTKWKSRIRWIAVFALIVAGGSLYSHDGGSAREGVIADSLIPMLVERSRLALEIGADHPRVKQLDMQIDVVKDKIMEHLPVHDRASQTHDVQALNDVQLRVVVGRLIARVEHLEKELLEFRTMPAIGTSPGVPAGDR
ncbi:MAG: hypothetical protein AAGJ40_04505 [Planctomycetota bacterium]